MSPNFQKRLNIRQAKELLIDKFSKNDQTHGLVFLHITLLSLQLSFCVHALVGVKWLVCVHDLKMLVSLVGSDIMPCNSKTFEEFIATYGGDNRWGYVFLSLL